MKRISCITVISILACAWMSVIPAQANNAPNPETFETFPATAHWAPGWDVEGWTVTSSDVQITPRQDWPHGNTMMIGYCIAERDCRLDKSLFPRQIYSFDFSLVDAGNHYGRLIFQVQEGPSYSSPKFAGYIDLLYDNGAPVRARWCYGKDWSYVNLPGWESIALGTWYTMQMEFDYSTNTHRVRFGPKNGNFNAWTDRQPVIQVCQPDRDVYSAIGGETSTACIDNASLSSYVVPDSLNVNGTLADYRGSLELVGSRIDVLQDDVVVATKTINPATNPFATSFMLAPGNYAIRVQVPKWLTRTVPVTVLDGQTVDANVTLANGDCDGDNTVTIADLSVALKNMGMVGDRTTVLVENGQGRCTIVVPANQDATIRDAAEDLAYHLNQMTGATIPIVNYPSPATGVPIYVGVVPDGVQLPVDLNDKSRFWPDGYLILADGCKVILAAPRVEGVRNAVYGLLEDYLGCHWFTPGKIGEYIPKRSTVSFSTAMAYDVSKRNLEYAQPGYSYPRVLDYDDEAATVNGVRVQLTSLGKWMIRNRYGGPKGEFCHYWSLIYTPAVFAQYPDLAPYYGGRRHTEGGGQVCMSNPRAAEIGAQFLINFFAQNPQYDFMTFGQNDGGGWCECPNCMAMASNYAGRVLILTNNVMQRVGEVYPDKRLTFLIYYNTFVPPDDSITADSRLIGVVCSAGLGSGGKQWMDQIKCKTDNQPDGVLYRQNVEGWMAKLHAAWSYDYYGWFAGPYTMFHKLQAEHDYYVSHGFTGDVSEYVDRNMGTDVLMWLTWHIAWNNRVSVDNLVSQFYPDYFGAAGDDMRYIYESLETYMRTAVTQSSHGTELSNVLGLYPLDLLDNFLARIAQAKAKVANDPTPLARVERDERCLTQARLFMQSYTASRAFLNAGNPADQTAAITAADQYVGLINSLNITMPRMATNFIEPFLFTKPGAFDLPDHLHYVGGRAWRAKSRSGFRPGAEGLYLAANARGDMIYELQTGANLTFKDATCQTVAGLQITVEISSDDGASWQTVLEDSGSPGMRTITGCVAGKNKFLIKFGAQNRSGSEILALDFLRITGNIE